MSVYLIPLTNYEKKFHDATAQPPNFNADLIVVPTGSKGRIACALAHLVPDQKLFITGVPKNLNLKSLCLHEGIPATTLKHLNTDNIELGHDALDTIGNEKEFKGYLLRHPEIKTVLGITSASHLPRFYGEVLDLVPKYNMTFAASDTSCLPLNFREMGATFIRSMGISRPRQRHLLNEPGH